MRLSRVDVWRENVATIVSQIPVVVGVANPLASVNSRANEVANPSRRRYNLDVAGKERAAVEVS